MSVLQCHFGSLSNKRDRISATSFCFPDMWKGVSGNAPFIFNLSANARSNCNATKEIFDANRSTHDTVGWLSLNIDMWSPDFTSHTYSITSYNKKVRPFPNPILLTSLCGWNLRLFLFLPTLSIACGILLVYMPNFC